MKSRNDSLLPRLRGWLPVAGLTASAFVFNTSEFVPIGLLSGIARDFSMTESHAGLLITVYAWVVAMASLPLMLLLARTDCRRLLLGVVSLFVASHLLSAVASSYPLLMASRVGVACAHALFWSIASPLAVRVAPHGRTAAALGLIVAGSSVAMIVGLPLGRIVGLHAGWRMTFFYIALAAAAVWGLLALCFPRTGSGGAVSLRRLPALLGRPALWGVYLLTVLLVTGHFTAYSYIEPFMVRVASMSDGAVTALLSLFGAVGIGGSVLFARCYDRRPAGFVRLAVGGIVASLLLLRPAAAWPPAVVLLVAAWGVSVTLFNLIFQSEIIRQAPEATAVAMSVYSGIYNVGIGGGALVGGIVCADLSVGCVGYVGGAIGLAALVYCFVRLLPLLRRA